MSEKKVKKAVEEVAKTNGHIKELSALVIQEKEERGTRALAQIEAILKKEKCELIPVVILKNNQVTATITIQAN